MVEPKFNVRFNLFFFLLLLITFASYAQKDQSNIFQKQKFHNISVSQGLSNNLVNAFAQDDLGFMWIGTADGLCRYGGNDFLNFRHNPDDINSLSNNYINDIYFHSASNRLWIGTNQGLDVLDLASMTFLHLDSLVIPDGSKMTVMAIKGRGDETIIGLKGKHLVKFDENFKAQIYDFSKDVADNLNLPGQVDVEWVNDSSVLISFYRDFVGRLNLKSGSIEFQTIGGIEFNKFNHTSNGEILLSSGTGLYSYDFSSKLFAKVKSQDLENQNIVDVFQDSREYLWVGTREQGLLISDGPFIDSKNPPNFIAYNPNYDGSSVFSKTVLSFFEDYNQGIWIGTWSSGITYSTLKSPDIYHIKRNNYSKSSISYNRVWGLCNAGDGKIWIGTDGGGLNLYNIHTGENEVFTHNSNDPNSISDDAVLSALSDSRGNFWFGTYKGGLNKYNYKSRKYESFQHDPNEPNSLSRNDVRLLFEDKSRRLWVGTNGGGLQVFDYQSETFQTIDEFQGIDMRSIQEDENGGFWVAPYSSWFAFYHPERNEVFKITPNDIPELSNDRISSLVLIGSDLWIGCRSLGLIKYSLKNHTYSILDEEDGLLNNSVRSMVNSDDDLWIATDRGISYLDLKTMQFESYGPSYGVQSGEFNVGSVLKLSNGLICFGGTEGLNIIDINAVKSNQINPPLYVTEITALDEPISHNKEFESVLYKKNLTLQHFQNVVTFDFEIVQFPVAPNELFYYKLEGSDVNWNLAKRANSITYGNLNPGSYGFMVARANMQNEPGEVTSLHLEISPPFWKSRLALVIYTFFGTVLILLILWYYTQQIKLRSSLVFEKKIRFQEHKLNQERIRFFTNFSHELRTPLTLIIGPLKNIINKSEKEEQVDGLKLIHRNAITLSNLINKMLEFRKAEVGHMKLEVSEYGIGEVLVNITSNYRDLAKVRGLQLVLNQPDEDIVLCFDIEKIEIIMNNLFSNAFKYTERGGTIAVSIIDSGKHVEISVKDTGKGIPKKSLKSVFQWYYQAGESKSISGTGIGLALTKKLVELHSGNIQVDSVESEGSTFTFSLPKGKTHLSHMTEVSGKSLSLEIPEHVETKGTFSEGDSLNESNEERARILIVDDNADIVQYLKQVLDTRYFVFSAADGQKGIDLAKEEIPDIIISDVMMPVKSGIDLCKDLKKDHRTSHIPIILLTAKHSPEDTVLGYSEGADSYMVKPFEEEVLLARIANLLDARVKLKSYFQAIQSEEEVPVDSAVDLRSKVEIEFLAKVESVILNESLEKGQEVGVYDLARELGFSRASLYRKLKSVTGCSINEFVRKVKLKKAEELISSGNMNVSEAAFYVGFSDVKYFRSIFKKEFNRLPSEVKKGAPERLL